MRRLYNKTSRCHLRRQGYLMLSTPDNLRMLLGGVPGIEDQTLRFFLERAALKAISDGIPETHSRFAEGQEYYAAHLMQKGGLIQGEVASKSVDGVSVSFVVNSSQPTGWLVEYRKLKASVAGITRMA